MAHQRTFIPAVTFFALVSTFSTLHAQVWEWVRPIGENRDNRRVHGSGAVTDDFGNTFMTGVFESVLTLGDQEHVGQPFYNGNHFVAKFDTDGAILWSKVFFGNPFARFELLGHFVDNDGALYLHGGFEDHLDFGDGVSLVIPKTYDPYDVPYKYFLCKYSADGSIAWAKYCPQNLTVTPNGKVVARGSLHGNLPLIRDFDAIESLAGSDTLRIYSSDAALETKKRFEVDLEDILMESIRCDGSTLWFDLRPRYSVDLSIADSIVHAEPNDFLVVGLESNYPYNMKSVNKLVIRYHYSGKQYFHNNTCYFFGQFLAGSRSVTFGDMVVSASTSEDDEGYLIKYDIASEKFLWAINVHDLETGGFRNEIIVKNNLIYLSRQHTSANDASRVSAYTIDGDWLWEKRITGSLIQNSGLGVDQRGNVYISGDGIGTISFDNISFSASIAYRGFLAKIHVSTPCSGSPVEISATICDNETFKIGDVEYSLPGTYMRTLTGMSGCDSVIVATLKVNPVKYTEVSASICPGETFAVGGKRYSVTGIYRDTLRSEAGCDSVVVANVVVKSLSATVQKDGDTLVAFPANAQYKWIDCSNNDFTGNSNDIFTPDQNGAYAVEVKKDGCTSVSDCVDFVVTGLETPFDKSSLRVSPNPGSGSFSVESRANKISNVRIFTTHGVELQARKEGTDHVLTIDLKSYPDGMYILQLLFENGVVTRRLIKRTE